MERRTSFGATISTTTSTSVVPINITRQMRTTQTHICTTRHSHPAQQASVDQDIAGLTYGGTLLAKANVLTPTTGAEYQAAIWEVEYQSLTNTDLTFQSAGATAR